MTIYNTLFPYVLFLIFAMFVYFGFLLKNTEVIEKFENTDEPTSEPTDEPIDEPTSEPTEESSEESSEEPTIKDKTKTPKPMTEKEYYSEYNDELFEKGNRDMVNLINTCKNGMENIEKITIKFHRR